MKSIEEYPWHIDARTIAAISLKMKSTEELDTYNNLQNAKVGYIKVHKISDNPGIEKDKVYEGVTGAFGEGLAVWISNPKEWFHTSVIKSIDWKNNTFKTLNSTYAFEFEELEYENLMNKLSDLGICSMT